MAASAKDYVAIANIVMAAALQHPDAEEAIEDLAGKLADHYGSENPRFDRVRFMAACSFPYTSDPWEDQV